MRSRTESTPAEVCSGGASQGRLAQWLGWTAVPAGLAVVWELAARSADAYLFPSFLEVMDRLVHPWQDLYRQGSLLDNTLVSLLRVMFGFAVAAVAGVALGLSMGTSRTLRALVEPLVEILRPLCPVAWIPFAIAVFGLATVPEAVGLRHTGTLFDEVQLGMLFVLFWGGFFPVLVNTLDGVSRVRRQYLRLAHTLGAGPWRTFWFVRLPAALPSILTGLRQGIGTCWFVLIAAEMLPGSDSGLGYLLLYASDLSGMDVVVAAMLIVGMIGAGLNFALVWVLRASLRWHGKEY